MRRAAHGQSSAASTVAFLYAERRAARAACGQAGVLGAERCAAKFAFTVAGEMSGPCGKHKAARDGKAAPMAVRAWGAGAVLAADLTQRHTCANTSKCAAGGGRRARGLRLLSMPSVTRLAGWAVNKNQGNLWMTCPFEP